MTGYRTAFARKRCLPVLAYVAEAAASAVAVGVMALTTLALVRQVRLRRHLHRLRTIPIEHGSD
jgi:hypothetical protein